MENTDKNIFEDERLRTDKSLKDERNQADDYIEHKNQKIEDKADEEIRIDRQVADKKLEEKRKKNDEQQSDNNLDIEQEREQTDKATKTAQLKADQVLTNERNEKQLATETLFESGRQHTDSDLSNERKNSDLAALERSALLSSEKDLHNITKTELLSRNQFLAMVSHDLKNPLAAVLLSVDLLQKQLDKKTVDAEKIVQCLKIIEQSARNMNRMINELLDLERISNDKLVLDLKRYDICLLLRECMDLFGPLAASKSLTLELAPCLEAMPVEIDHDRIFQVLSNLIGNALKFAPAEGIIKLSSEAKTDSVEISVSDNGPGIPEENRKEIFDRFSQFHTKDRQGLGLGLFIAKWIVEEHQGRIWVSSNSGSGSVFTFTLPLKRLH